MIKRKKREIKNNWGDYHLYSLVNSNGMQVDVSDLGATIVNLFINDGSGNRRNIVLGYDTPEEYLAGNVFLGCVVGPWANRIAKGEFSLAGSKIQLERNEGSNHLHGASANIGKKRWLIEKFNHSEITLLVSVKAGESGYPADIDFRVHYQLTNDNKLRISYGAIPKATTPINMTQHTYFNLNGGQQDIQQHHIQLLADSFLEVDDMAIPVAEVPVEGTAMDLRLPKLIVEKINSECTQLINAGGYDHCWCLKGNGMKKAALVSDLSSGISLEVTTDQQGIQFYSGNFLDNEVGRNGDIYATRFGLCLETQCYPNQINTDNAAACTYKAGEKYTHTTIYKFLVN